MMLVVIIFNELAPDRILRTCAESILVLNMSFCKDIKYLYAGHVPLSIAS